MKNINYLKDQLLDQGELQVSIYEEDKVRPISDVNIKIISKYDYTVIEELVTDSLGQTDTIELVAPPLEYSLNEQGGKPYSEYNLSIRADGFEPVDIHGIQILPESKTLQLVHLKPIEDINYGTRTISISEHTLWGNYPSKILEDEVKNRDDSVEGIVLSKPIIPQYVIVHLGEPTNTSVRDVRVLFKDYVKNVASSEIYATWPEETIKANILTIVSFVLNRYHTKWYSKKGYEFTITNSTAFDQAFVYERNIFETISNIVDEIFATYITKPEIKQPLLTQHYDGERLKCEKGLSQWGSKKMGDEGHNFLNILKNYYGEGIYLEQAEKVEGVSIPYPGSTIAVGSTGADVRTIQQQLNAISNNCMDIIKLKVDGVYGKITSEAVINFQKINNMLVTGIIDFNTWYQISNVYATVTNLEESTFRNFHDIYEPYRY